MPPKTCTDYDLLWDYLNSGSRFITKSIFVPAVWGTCLLVRRADVIEFNGDCYWRLNLSNKPEDKARFVATCRGLGIMPYIGTQEQQTR